MRDVLAQQAEPTPNARADDARLTGAPLALARVGWGALTAVAVGLLVIATPLAYQQMIIPRTGPQCADTRLTAAQLGALHAAGIAPTSFAVWVIAVSVFQTLVYVGVGAALFWRRSEHRVALLAATTLVLVGVTGSDTHWLGAGCALRPAWSPAGLLFDLLGVAANLLVAVLFCTFPSGRWVPRRGLLLVLCYTVVMFPKALLPDGVNDFFASHPWIGITTPILITSFLIAQVHRYMRVSTPAERVQTKWVVLGGGIGFGENVVLIIVFALFYHPTSHTAPLFLLYAGTAIELGFILFPITIGIALLRSRLFDVDQIINRVLVYGSLTGILGLFYLGGVVALQSLVHALTGQTQPVIVVITTLAIAALVQPLRRALQRGIDRRFYRRKYDAARTLAAFSATLRDEVDLTRLRDDLLAVVEETMQPRHLSLWLPAAHQPPASESAANT